LFFGVSYNNVGSNRDAKLLILIIRYKWDESKIARTMNATKAEVSS